MKRVLVGTIACACSATATAMPVFHPSGDTLTYGRISNGQSIMSSLVNPAASAVALEDGENEYRFGVLSSIGGGYEFGPVDNLIDDMDRLADELAQEELSITDANRTINEFNEILPAAGEDGYAELHASVHLPIMPIVVTHEALGGSIAIDANAGVQGQLNVLDAPLTFNPIQQVLQTNSALYVKGAVVQEVAAGYSRKVLDLDWPGMTGGLYTGLRVRYLSAGMRKTVTPLNTTDDVGEELSGQWDEDFVYANNVTADLGLLFASEKFRIGATFANLTQPEFEYDAIGVDCALDDTSCLTAQSFSNEIDLHEKWVLDPQTTLEGALFTPDGLWVIGASLDANAVRDPVGNEVQRASVSATYATKRWLGFGFRVGYTANLVGSELSYLSLGGTVAGFNLDLAYGLESIESNGSAVPRTAALNLGYGVTF